MIIQDVRLTVVDNPHAGAVTEGIKGGTARHQIVLIEVVTDEGLEGQAFAWGGRSGLATAHLLAAIVRPLLIGEDPLNREYLWQKVRSMDRWWGFLPIYAAGPLDVALWDLGAKAANLPLYRFLGAYRDRLPAYASSLILESPEAFADQALGFQSEGYTAYKLHPWGDPQRDVEACRAVRRAVGDGMVLMSDPVGAYTPQQALRVGRALEELGYYWFEEPLPDYDLHGYRELARQLDIPIAGTESLAGGLMGTTQYIVQGAVDIVRSDVSWKGGVTGLMKTAALCEAFGLNCEVHTTTNALLDAANLHVSCAIRNCEYFEILVPQAPFSFGVTDPIRIDERGDVRPGDRPGLGVELDWDRLRHYTVATI
ncbi:MAG: mandelate racemase [Luteitalea sp.]|nr:mandelate racemase [Luteitalea sp.]